MPRCAQCFFESSGRCAHLNRTGDSDSAMIGQLKKREQGVNRSTNIPVFCCGIFFFFFFFFFLDLYIFVVFLNNLTYFPRGPFTDASR